MRLSIISRPASTLTPVMLPPGLAKLAAKPAATGSSVIPTTGMVLVSRARNCSSLRDTEKIRFPGSVLDNSRCDHCPSVAPQQGSDPHITKSPQFLESSTVIRICARLAHVGDRLRRMSDDNPVSLCARLPACRARHENSRPHGKCADSAGELSPSHEHLPRERTCSGGMKHGHGIGASSRRWRAF